MQINLKQYQEKAVSNLVKKINNFLENTDNNKRTAVLQAPTGSGKTVMVASVIDKLISENKGKDKPHLLTFIWLSIGQGELHRQSKKALERYFNGYPDVQIVDDVFGTSQDTLLKDTVIVASWNKIYQRDKETSDWKAIVMKDGEQTNFREMINNFKDPNSKVILIVDESQRNLNTLRGKEIVELIGPSVTLEVSATPIMDFSTSVETIKETIAPQDVIDEEMIKDQILVNYDFTINKNDDSDDAILRTALNKRKELLKKYSDLGVEVNPLLLIQLPNADEGEVIKQSILAFLQKEEGILTGDQRLSIWLDGTDVERNLEDISKNDAVQEVLIFKQAIDTGWDCPRAQILLKFREVSGSEIFDIQILGRILRMPEQMHYEDESLNKAYVYVNTEKAEFKIENYNPKILGDMPAIRKGVYNNLNLRSFYKERADYQDVKKDFRSVLLKKFEEELNLNTLEHKKNIEKLKKNKWEFDINNLSHNVISNLKLEVADLDINTEIMDDDRILQELKTNIRQVEFLSKKLFRNMMSPFTNVARSIPSMNTAWVLVCRSLFGESGLAENYLGSQSFLILNYPKIKPIFIGAINEYAVIRRQKAISDTEKIINNFEVTQKDFYNRDLDEAKNYDKNLMSPCCLEIERSGPEKSFEKYIDQVENVKWWYKNGENRKDYFGIKYVDEGDTRTFYPDFLVQFKDGTLGIFETKSSVDRDQITKLKAIALQEYIKEESKKTRKIIGGIVVERNGEILINRKTDFDLSRQEDLEDLGSLI